jgi:hypothetical protein
LVFSQNKPINNCEDSISHLLRSFLIQHSDFYTLDSHGNKTSLDEEFLWQEFGETKINIRNLCLRCQNLSSNSIGVYLFRFACVEGCLPQLFIRYSNKVEFIDINSADFKFDETLVKILDFFALYPDQFKLEEELLIIKEVIDNIYDNRFVK